MALDIDTSTLNSTTKDTYGGTFANLRDSFKRVLSPDRSPIERKADHSPTGQDRSRSRGREFQSTGRGGAGNIVRSESVSRDRADGFAGEERGREILPANRVTHSGRGGAGNIRSPSRDPQGDIREMSREHDIIENHRKTEENQVHSTGRGGFGNMDRSRSRSREPNKLVHSSGRGGFGNIVNGDGRDLADLEEEERVQYAHAHEHHSSGRGGAGNVTAGAAPTVETAHAPVASEGQWRSSGRGGAGNMTPVIKDAAAAAEEGRGRKQGSSIGGFIDRLTSRSRDPAHHDK